MKNIGHKILNQFIVMIVVSIMTLIGQRIGYKIPIAKAIPGMILILMIAMISVIIKDFMPRSQFPAFAWATLIALVLTMPFMPTAKFVLGYTNQVNFLGTTTPILAFAGISVGMKILQLKKLSWRLVIVACFVFIGTFFGSAIIAQIVLKLQGII